MRVGKEIALEARKQGLCDDWYRDMMNISTFKELCAMYFKGDDWAMEKDFPNAELSRKFKGGISPFGLKVDDQNTYTNIRHIALLGRSHASLEYDSFSVAQIVIRHDSKVSIKVSGYAKIYVNVLDGAEVDIECDENAKVTVYDYGNKTKIVSQGNVKVVLSKWEK